MIAEVIDRRLPTPSTVGRRRRPFVFCPSAVTQRSRWFWISDWIPGRADPARHTRRGRRRGPGQCGHGGRNDTVAVPVHRKTGTESTLETQGQPSHRRPVGRRPGKTR